jgi:hypothetical protein
MTTAELLAEIRVAIESVETWKPQHGLAAHGACAWEGDSPDDNGGGWRILVAVWPVETTDETPARATVLRWGYDGTAVRAPMVVRLTPELAELAARHARNL